MLTGANDIYTRYAEAQRNRFVWDVWNLFCEQISTSTSSFIPHPSSLYCRGLGLSGTLRGIHLRKVYGGQAGGVGGLLSQTEITSSGASSYFPFADANGKKLEADKEWISAAGSRPLKLKFLIFGRYSINFCHM